MDKLKVALAQMKKHHFWIMGVVVIILSLVSWFVASSNLWADYLSNRAKVEREFSELRQITSVTHHPNQGWITGVGEETSKLKAQVLGAWELAYNEQRDEVLKWPGDLGEDFLEIINSLGPNEEIPLSLRERYFNYIKNEFPHLLEIVDVRDYREKAVEEPMRGGRRNPKAVVPEAPKHDYKVVWDPKDQADVDEKLDWKVTPNSQEVRFTQEDLWVYRALLEIIARLNERATGHHNAKVKEIVVLSIGRAAAKESLSGISQGRIVSPAASFSPQVAPGMRGGLPQPTAPPVALKPPAAVPAAMPGMTMGAGPGTASSLDDGRYVDEKGMPLGADAKAPPEFKRMPVYMRLFMDQREVSRLLVECANSPLPIEVRQLRLNPSQSSDGSKSKAGRGAANPMAAIPFGRGPNIRQPAGPRPGVLDEEEQDRNPYDLTVELHGIIYIFNPPDMKKLADVVAPGAGEQPAGDNPADETTNAAPTRPEEAAKPAEDEAPEAKETNDAANIKQGKAADRPAEAGGGAAGKEPAVEDETEK